MPHVMLDFLSNTQLSHPRDGMNTCRKYSRCIVGTASLLRCGRRNLQVRSMGKWGCSGQNLQNFVFILLYLDVGEQYTQRVRGRCTDRSRCVHDRVCFGKRTWSLTQSEMQCTRILVIQSTPIHHWSSQNVPAQWGPLGGIVECLRIPWGSLWVLGILRPS